MIAIEVGTLQRNENPESTTMFLVNNRLFFARNHENKTHWKEKNPHRATFQRTRRSRKRQQNKSRKKKIKSPVNPRKKKKTKHLTRMKSHPDSCETRLGRRGKNTKHRADPF